VSTPTGPAERSRLAAVLAGLLLCLGGAPQPLPGSVLPVAVAAASAPAARLAAARAQPQQQPRQAVQDLRTASELSGFARHTSYDEMVEYLEAVGARSPEMRLSTFAHTREGRAMPFAIFARPALSTHQEALLSGKPILVLAANVHGGERTLRESVLIMTRDLATPGTELNRMLDDLVILVVPTLNPDGFSATPGGTRGNAWGIDLNRDYIKLEHPEIAGYVGNILNTWYPHLWIDGHNGGAQPYNLNYQCVSNAAADQRITELCDREIFPYIDRQLGERGYKSWYYTGGTPTRWNTGGFEARIGRNYGGMANSIGILFESPSQTLATGVDAGIIGYTAVVRFVHQNRQKVLELIRSAREETVRLGQLAQGDIPVRMRYEPEPYRVTYELVQGQGDQRRIITVQSDSLMKRPVATLLRPRPYAYVLPRDAVDAVAMLRRHNIAVEVLLEPVSLEVQAYTLAGVRYRSEYNHAAATVVEVGDVVTTTRDFPRGSYVVPTGQVLGRVVTHMLEPETPDNIIYWNTMDAWLPKAAVRGLGATPVVEDDAPVGGGGGAAGGGPGQPQGPPLIPIFKIMTPTALPVRLIR
jgi:dipeptidyl-peptidase-4